MNVGAQIRQLREMHQCTQGQLSRMCGWTQPQMARIEASPTQLTVTTLVRVADALGLALKITFESVGESKLPTHPGSSMASRNDEDNSVTGTFQKKAATKRLNVQKTDAASLAYWERLGIAL